MLSEYMNETHFIRRQCYYFGGGCNDSSLFMNLEDVKLCLFILLDQIIAHCSKKTRADEEVS